MAYRFATSHVMMQQLIAYFEPKMEAGKWKAQLAKF